MACLDNAVRAGLTPKLRDTNVLYQIVDYVAQEQCVLNGQVISQYKRLVCYYLCSFGVVSDSETMRINRVRQLMMGVMTLKMYTQIMTIKKKLEMIQQKEQLDIMSLAIITDSSIITTCITRSN